MLAAVPGSLIAAPFSMVLLAAFLTAVGALQTAPILIAVLTAFLTMEGINISSPAGNTRPQPRQGNDTQRQTNQQMDRPADHQLAVVVRGGMEICAHSSSPGPKIAEEIRTTRADRGSRFGEGAGSGLGCEVTGTVAAEPVTDSDTRAGEGAEQRLSGKCAGRRRLLHPRRARRSSPSSSAGGPDQVMRR